jgi:hypothetical protein
MKSFGKHQVAGIAMFTVGCTLIGCNVAAAAGPPGGLAVEIVQPLPMPITGSTTVTGTVGVNNFPATQGVSGTVTAVQGGTWSVGVNGPVALATDSPLLCRPEPPANPFLYSTPRNGPVANPAVVFGPALTSTRLAITSVVFANQDLQAGAVEVYVDDCAGNGHATKLFAFTPATGTFTASFPTPLMVAVIAPGATWCLNVDAFPKNGALEMFTIVGYTI